MRKTVTLSEPREVSIITCDICREEMKENPGRFRDDFVDGLSIKELDIDVHTKCLQDILANSGVEAKK